VLFQEGSGSFCALADGRRQMNRSNVMAERTRAFRSVNIELPGDVFTSIL
jgi:hypothetical protein